MAITIDERVKSRFSTTGISPNAELHYVLQGYEATREEDTDAAARVALRDAAPLTFDIYGDA